LYSTILPGFSGSLGKAGVARVLKPLARHRRDLVYLRPPMSPVQPVLPVPILVLGAGGLVGTELTRLLQERRLAHATRTHHAGDITSAEDVRSAIAESEAQLVINCAAYNAVDRAETEGEEALRVNAGGAGTVAQAAPIVVHYSTDFVFDGRKDSPYVEEDA